MPIDLRKHDSDGQITIRSDTNKAKIIKLLYQNTDLGYTPAEVRKQLELPRGSTLRPILVSTKKGSLETRPTSSTMGSDTDRISIDSRRVSCL